MHRSLQLTAAALTFGLLTTASAEQQYFQELLLNGDFEAGDVSGWEEDNAFGGRKWSVATGPLGASGMTPADASKFATPFNSGPISMPWGTLLQSIDLDSLTYPTLTVPGGSPAASASLGGSPGDIVFDRGDATDQDIPTYIPGTLPPGSQPGGMPANPGSTVVQLEPTDRLSVSVEAIFGYDRIQFELHYLDTSGQLLRVDDLGTHGYLPELNQGPWSGVSKVITDEVLLPKDTRYISFWARTELVLGTYIDAGFDNASLQLELVPGAVVPEPTGLAALAVGGLLLGRRRK